MRHLLSLLALLCAFFLPLEAMAGSVPAPKYNRTKVAILFIGQSVTQGNVQVVQMTASASTSGVLTVSDIFVGTTHAAQFMGTISGNTLTVQSVTQGTIAIGQYLYGVGYGNSTSGAVQITAGSGTSWTLSGSPAAVSTSTSMGSGPLEAIEIGALVQGPGIPAGTTITSQLSGVSSANGNIGLLGTYQLSQNPASTVSSETMQVGMQEAFQSLVNPGLTSPLFGTNSTSGNSLIRLYDDLWAYGYDAQIVNGAKGSMSLVSHGVGQVGARSAGNYSLFERRYPAANGTDRGFYGTVINPLGTNIWVLTCLLYTSDAADE